VVIEWLECMKVFEVLTWVGGWYISNTSNYIWWLQTIQYGSEIQTNAYWSPKTATVFESVSFNPLDW